jgi:phosphatidate phosphatase APP1
VYPELTLVREGAALAVVGVGGERRQAEERDEQRGPGTRHAGTVSRLAFAIPAGILAVIVFLFGSAEAFARSAHVGGLTGWASTEAVTVMGRAVKGDPPSGRAHGRSVSKLGSTAKAFLRSDLEHAAVRVTDVVSGRSLEGVADDEGFFDLRLPGPFPAGPRELLVEVQKDRYRAEERFTLPVIPADAEGVIVVADIDDTLVHTGVTAGKATMIWTTVARGAADMKPFPAAPAVLSALAEAGAPVVYLTASPIELAPRLGQFLREGRFPTGALLMRYWARDGIARPDVYKRKRVDRLLADFPRKKLVLFGDNGERDPELFAALARDTGRVEVAYVRATVAASPADPRYREQVVFGHYREVARDLARRGLIRWWRGQRIHATP